MLTSATVQRGHFGHSSTGHVEMKPSLELKRRNKNAANGKGLGRIFARVEGGLISEYSISHTAAERSAPLITMVRP